MASSELLVLAQIILPLTRWIVMIRNGRYFSVDQVHFKCHWPLIWNHVDAGINSGLGSSWYSDDVYNECTYGRVWWAPWIKHLNGLVLTIESDVIEIFQKILRTCTSLSSCMSFFLTCYITCHVCGQWIFFQASIEMFCEIVLLTLEPLS